MTGAELYLHYLQELTELSEQVESAAREQDWDILLTCLDRRQVLMDQVDALPDEARMLTAEQNAHATEMLEQMAERDDSSRSVLDTAIMTTRSVLQEGSHTRAGISAYRRAASSNPQAFEARFVDKNR